LPVRRIDAIVHHENSSTLKSGYEQKNAVSYRNNNELFEAKVLNDDYNEGTWSLRIRRANSWD
jgi:hypothetical protein